MDNRAAISQIITGLAEYYDKQLSVTQLAMYVEDLLDVEPSKLLAAVREYRRDGRNVFFPLPAKLKALAYPESDPEAEAVEAVSRIVQAVANIGPYRTEDARSFVGELGWLVVTRDGGWQNVCQNLTEENMGTLKAQWRQLAIAQHKRAKAGLVDAPALPTPQTGGLIDMTKLLPRMPGMTTAGRGEG